MKHLVMSFCALSLLAGCDDFEGVTVIKSKLTVVDKKQKQATISPGSYEIKFDYDEGDRERKMICGKKNSHSVTKR